LSLINRIGNAPKPAQPIFHYTSPKVVATIVANGDLWLSNAAYLNDQGELAYPARVATAVLADAWKKEKDDSIRELLRATSQSLVTHALFKSWFVASFSAHGNLLSQWRAYCRRGGYSIGFDGSSLADVIQRDGERQL
jgi:hypothetical protein